MTLLLESTTTDKYGDLKELAEAHVLVLLLGAAYVEEYGPLESLRFKSDGRRAWVTVLDRGPETFRKLVHGDLGTRFFNAGITGEMLVAS